MSKSNFEQLKIEIEVIRNDMIANGREMTDVKEMLDRTLDQVRKEWSASNLLPPETVEDIVNEQLAIDRAKRELAIDRAKKDSAPQGRGMSPELDKSEPEKKKRVTRLYRDLGKALHFVRELRRAIGSWERSGDAENTNSEENRERGRANT